LAFGLAFSAFNAPARRRGERADTARCGGCKARCPD
jgi:hypothetical protein